MLYRGLQLWRNTELHREVLTELLLTSNKPLLFDMPWQQSAVESCGAKLLAGGLEEIMDC